MFARKSSPEFLSIVTSCDWSGGTFTHMLRMRWMSPAHGQASLPNPVDPTLPTGAGFTGSNAVRNDELTANELLIELRTGAYVGDVRDEVAATICPMICAN